MNPSISSLSQWTLNQLLVQTASVAASFVILGTQGIEFFGLYSFYQVLVSLLAIIIGYRQDISILSDARPVSSVINLYQSYFLSIAIAILSSVSYFLLDEESRLSFVSLSAAGLCLALFELNTAALIKIKKDFLWFASRISLPLASTVLILSADYLSPENILLMSNMIAFIVSGIAIFLSTNPMERLVGRQDFGQRINENFFPTVNGLIFFFVASFPLIFAQQKFDPYTLGIVAIVLRFVGGPVTFAASAVAIFALKENLLDRLSQFLKGSRKTLVFIGMLSIALLASLLFLKESSIVAIIYLSFAVFLQSLVGSSQPLIQSRGESGSLTSILIAQTPIFYYYYFFVSELSFLLFVASYFFVFVFAFGFVFYKLTR